MSDVTFVSGGYQYTYNEAALRAAMQGKGLGAEAIEQALTEIAQGDFSTLESLGLTSYISRTELDLPKPGASSPGSVSLTLDRVNIFNFLEVMKALHEASKELRQANREMRHAERDTAMAESMIAADKIRSAALTNMIFGVVSGAVNIGMGLFSMASAAKQMTAMKGPAADIKAAKVEMKQVKADIKLAEAQTKLQAAKVEVAAKTANAEKIDAQVKATQDVRAAEQRAATARETAPPDPAEIEAAETDLAAKQQKLADLGGEKTDADLAEAVKAKTEAQEKVAELETEVKGLAAEAEKANAGQIKELEKSIQSKEKEIASLKDDNAKNPSPETEAKVRAAESELATLQTKLQARQNQIEMYRNPTSDEALAGAEGRLTENTRLAGPNGEVGKRFAESQTTLNDIVTKAQVEAARIQGLNTAAGGLEKGLSGVGGVVSGEQQAEQHEHDAQAQKAQAASDESADYQKAFNEMLQSVQNLLKEVLQNQNQANAAIYRNM